MCIGGWEGARKLGNSGDCRHGIQRYVCSRHACLEVNTVQVIGERLVTPSSIVFLLVKLRVKEPGTSSPSPVQDAKSAKRNDDIDEKFLNARGEAEQLEMEGARYAHAPYWPGVRPNS